MRSLFLLILVALAAAWPPAFAAEAPRTIIVMDGSGSMWGRIDGVPKLEIARDTLTEVLAGLPDTLELGLMAYGHRQKGDCGDIELMVAPAAGSGPAIAAAAASMRFLGKTPLSAAVRAAAEELRFGEEAATVVLITDGIETCEADPCALASALDAEGIGFTAHVIGFGLSGEEGAQVVCIAENTGGRYIPAGDGAALAEALAQTVGAAEPAPAAPVPAAAPDRPSHFGGAPLMSDIAISPTGGAFGPATPSPEPQAFPSTGTIAQCRAICEGDALCGSWRYEPAGSFFVDYARCFTYGAGTEFWTTASAPGEGWASGMKDGVIGLVRPYVPVNGPPQDVEVSLIVPEPVAPGSLFTVLWSGPAGDNDWVDLVPVGHEELWDELAYFRVNDTIEAADWPEGAGELTAPDASGDYELRYVFGRHVDRRVLLRIPLRVGMAGDGAGLAPAELVEVVFSADTGVDVPIVWSAVPVPGQDLPPEAWAMQEALAGPVTEMFFPGTYDVLGEGDGATYAARVEITAGAPNRFTIPLRP